MNRMAMSLVVGAGIAASAPVAGQGADVGAGVYLFHYQPLDIEGARARSEIYAAFLTLDHRDGPWVFRVEGRARDTKLRAWYTGTSWFQEVWAGYEVRSGEGAGGSLVSLRAGKIYQRYGRFWDGSFFGNVHYFDGLKLNPQFGVQAEYRRGAGPVDLAVLGQYLAVSDGVSGALSGRDFETFADQRDRHTLVGRLTAGWTETLRLGVSVMSRGVQGDPLPSDLDPRFRTTYAAADVELRRGPVTVYGEWSRRDADRVPGLFRALIPGSRAEWLLIGGQAVLGPVHLRYNFSSGEYDDIQRVDRIHQPGATAALAENLHALAELNLWTTEAPDAGGQLIRRTTDRSLNLVLLLAF